jgi:DNA polymerase-3 subunit delta
MTLEEILKQFTSKQLKQVYFFAGEESYFIDILTEKAENLILSDAEKSFNQTVFYGKETNWKTLLETLNRYPMMAARQVVILKEAQQFKDWDELEPYLLKPTPTTIFVVAFKDKLDKRKKFTKALTKGTSIVYYESMPIKDWDVENWIKQYVTEKGFKINTATAAILKEYLGNNLQVIVNELSKLTINLPANKEINQEDIEKYIGISREYNVFELQKAIATKDTLKAQRFVNYCRANPKSNPFPLMMGFLYSYYSKLFLLHQHAGSLNDGLIAELAGLNPRNANALQEYKIALKNLSIKKIERNIGYLQEYDLKFKGVNNVSMEDADLLQEMTLKMMQ